MGSALARKAFCDPVRVLSASIDALLNNSTNTFIPVITFDFKDFVITVKPVLSDHIKQDMFYGFSGRWLPIAA